MNILVVVAHLDDEIFGIGGSLYQWKQHNVKIVSMCKGRDDNNTIERKHAADKLQDLLACKYKVYNFLDMTLEKVLLKDIAALIELEISEYNPDIVLTVSENDIHQDHKIVSHATKIACRRSNVKELLEFQIPGSEPYSCTYFDTFNNISMDVKQRLCEIYESEKMPEINNTEYFKTIYRQLQI